MDRPIRNILIPVSLQDTTERLVAQGARLATAFGSTVWLLHIFKTPSFTSSHRLPPELKEEQEKEVKSIHRALDALANSLQKQNLDVHAYMLPGSSPADLILEQAEAIQADLIVIGLHGRSAIVEALLGDVTHDVLRKAPCPVLVIPMWLTLPKPADAKKTSDENP